LRPGTTLLGTALTVLSCAALLAVCPPRAWPQSGRVPTPQSQAYLHYSLGRLLEVSGALNDALVQFRRADGLDPGRCGLSIAVARTLYELGDTDGALAKSGQALALCPGDLEATAIHARLLLLQGDAAEVERLLTDRVREASAPRELAIMYGQALLSQGKLEEGTEFLRERASRDSMDAGVASLLGRAELLLGDSEAAVRDLGRSARIDPDDRSVSGMLGRLLISMDRPGEGVPLLERSVEGRRPPEPELVTLAAGYSMLGRPERAHATLDSAVAIYGETPAILRARGAVYFEEGDPESAFGTYERLLDVDPDSAMALNYIAYTLADEDRDLDIALKYAKRAVELEPQNPLYRDTLGWARFRAGDLEQARSDLMLAIELGGDSPIVLEHLGDIESGLGNTGEALEAWTGALRLSPGLPSAIERLEEAGAVIPDTLRGDTDGGNRNGAGR
jgi:tetratricopeptide (TPR) repeat protein